MDLKDIQAFILDWYEPLTRKRLIRIFFMVLVGIIFNIFLITIAESFQLLLWLLLICLSLFIIWICILGNGNNRSIHADRQLQGCARTLVVFALVTMILIDDTSISHMYIYIILFIFILINIILAIKLTKRKIIAQYYRKKQTQKKYHMPESTFGKAGPGIAGAMLGPAINSIIFAHITESAEDVILFVFLSIPLMVFVHLSCISFYKAYLLKKHCPDLSADDDR